MDWTITAIICFVAGMAILYNVIHHVTPTPESLQLKKWNKIAADLAVKYQLTPETLMPNGYNPMYRAMFRRNILADLVWTGHGQAARNVLAEADRIISTIEANHYALDAYGYGKWVHNETTSTARQRYYDWTPNKNERFAALDKETDAMLAKLDELIEYVRSIAVEGVNASTEAAKVHLQTHLQDLTATKEAHAARVKELENAKP